MNVAQPIEWSSKGVVMLDQRRLPAEVIRHTYTDYREVAAAIKDMVIRGAPAIGVAAAMGVALGVERSSARTPEELRAEFPGICQTIARTRPTAVDLFWAIERMTRRFELLSAENSPLDATRRGMVEEARAIHAEKRATDEAMGRFGAELMPAEGKVMTQCTAGALATAGIALRPMAIRPTRSAPTRLLSWRTSMVCRFTLPRRFLPSISRFHPENRFPSKSALPTK